MSLHARDTWDYIRGASTILPRTPVPTSVAPERMARMRARVTPFGIPWIAAAMLAVLVAGRAHARGPARCASPAATAAPEALEAAEAALRELAWDEMARFFEGAPAGAEPEAAEDPATSTGVRPLVDVLAALQGKARQDLLALAAAAAVDRLGAAGPRLRARALGRLAPETIAALLQADDPTLRANVWLWLAEGRGARCVLVGIEPALLEAALADRSRVVEDGADLVFRSVAHYAMAAALRRAGDDAAIDARLAEIAEGSPSLRPLALGAWIRRAPPAPERLAGWLADDDPAVRLAAALAAWEIDPAEMRARLLAFAAAEPIDRVTQGIVDALADAAEAGPRGDRAATLAGIEGASPRTAAALFRWRGEGSQTDPLPPPAAPPLSDPIAE